MLITHNHQQESAESFNLNLFVNYCHELIPKDYPKKIRLFFNWFIQNQPLIIYAITKSSIPSFVLLFNYFPQNPSIMYVLKRDGRRESVKFDKITARIEKLCYSLDPFFVQPLDVAKKVITGGYFNVPIFLGGFTHLIVILVICLCNYPR